jgi:Tol biopolymer transport system component
VYREPPAPPKKRGLRWVVIAAALGLAAIAVSVLTTVRPPLPRPAVVRFEIPVPADADFAISPEGTVLAYTADGHLWLRPLNAFSAREVTGVEGAQKPFWSPDSRYIGFAAQGRLKKIEVQGDASGSVGPVLPTICDTPRFGGGAWSREGEILFSDGRELYRVPVAGGTRQRLIQVDGSRGEMAHRWPQLLPDPKRFLFSAVAAQPENGGVYAASLDGRRTRVLAGAGMAAEAQGYLLAVRDGLLMAHPFDVARLQVYQEARPVRFAEQVRAFSVSGRTLAYRSGPEPVVRLTWFDRDGRMQATLGEPAEYDQVSISPDGRRAVAVGSSGVWLLDLERDTAMRVSFGEGRATSAIWSPDATRIAFAMHQANGSGIFVQQANAADQPRPLFRANGRLAVDSWSPDGRLLLYDERNESRGSAIQSLEPGGGTKPAPVLRSDFQVGSARLSPDQRWMAYVSNETGRDEVYVQSYPGPGGKWLISQAGGEGPAWRGDGRELFFLAADHALMSVEMRVDAQALNPGIPRPLLRTRQARSFAAAPDGRRFLVAAMPADAEPASLKVVLNWPEDLGR